MNAEPPSVPTADGPGVEADPVQRDIERRRQLKAELKPLEAQLVVAVRGRIQDQVSQWRALPWAAVLDAPVDEDGDPQIAYSSTAGDLVVHGRWTLDGDVFVEVATGQVETDQDEYGRPSDRDAEELLLYLLDREAWQLDPGSVAAKIFEGPQRGNFVVGWQALLDLVRAGKLLPRWRCLELCPGCPDSVLSQAVVTLARDGWNGSFAELAEAAQLLVGQP